MDRELEALYSQAVLEVFSSYEWSKFSFGMYISILAITMWGENFIRIWSEGHLLGS